MEKEKLVFGFGIIYDEDKYWIAQKEKFTSASEGGKINEREGYFILNNLPKNGFESASMALEYLAELSKL